MIRNSKIAFIILIIVLQASLYAQNTVVDTVYSNPALDGNISYSVYFNNFGVGTNSDIMDIGDLYSSFEGTFVYERGFLSFPLPNIPENYTLNTATLYVYQYCSIGNSIVWQYPVFNMETGAVEPPCLIEHIDYGSTLDVNDFDTNVLNPADTITTTPEEGWRNIKITDWVLDDVEENRLYTQARIRFTINYDIDHLQDQIGFLTANLVEEKPHCVYEYTMINENIGYNLTDNKDIFSVYPNPIYSSSKIIYNLSEQQTINMDLYNLKGQKVREVYSGFSKIGNNEIQLSSNGLANGIYLLKVSCGLKKSIIKKVIILR